MCESQQSMDYSSRDVLTVLPDHFPCLLRNLYVGQEATVRTSYGTNNWFKNNLRYRDDTTTLTAESEEEQKSLLMRVKEESEKNQLKT